MGIKNCVILFAVFMIGVLPFFSSVCADDDVTVNIYMLGEDARTRFGNPVIVAGIWHYINVTLENQVSQELILKFYMGGSMPAIWERDEANYYEWRYTASNQEWTDINEYGGYSYINDTNCQKMGDIHSFCVGVKDTLPDIADYYENWTLEIYKNNDADKLYSENVVLEKPMVGLAKTHADVIKFNVDPFTEMDVKGDDYFIIGNTGNIPLDIAVVYGAYNDVIEVTDSGKKLSPYTTFNHYVTLHSGSWKPGILKIPGTEGSTGSIPSSLVITTAVITFEITTIINAADLEVYIGHSNYTIEEIPGTHIVFQHEKQLEMNEGQIRDITVYISGEGNATLDISGDEVNVAVLKITSEDQEGTPLIITSTNTSEYAVTIRVEALRENKVGVINYELEVDGEIQTFSTQITIGPPLQQETSEEINIPPTTIIIALCIIFVIGYMIFAQIRHGRR